MRPQFSHDVLTSFVLWLDNTLCGTGQAYQNVTGNLYRGAQTGIPGFIYSSPYRAWVYDGCVGGAVVPSGFYASGSNQFLTAASGLGIDYLNGRVISAIDRGPVLTGIYSRKEINVYPSTTEESNYILEQLYNGNHNLKYPLTGLYGSEYVAPLIMVTNTRSDNQPWALGGMDNTTSVIRCFTISNNNYLQEGVNSILRDQGHSYIPLAPISAAPFTNVNMTSTGTLKTPGWSYCNDIKGVFGCANGLYIENSYPFKLNEKSNSNPTFQLSVIDMDVVKPRMPRG